MIRWIRFLKVSLERRLREFTSPFKGSTGWAVSSWCYVRGSSDLGTKTMKYSITCERLLELLMLWMYTESHFLSSQNSNSCWCSCLMSTFMWLVLIWFCLEPVSYIGSLLNFLSLITLLKHSCLWRISLPGHWLFLAWYLGNLLHGQLLFLNHSLVKTGHKYLSVFVFFWETEVASLARPVLDSAQVKPLTFD